MSASPPDMEDQQRTTLPLRGSLHPQACTSVCVAGRPLGRVCFPVLSGVNSATQGCGVVQRLRVVAVPPLWVPLLQGVGPTAQEGS